MELVQKDPKKTAQPKLKMKGEARFRHDLFKGSVGLFKSNKSYIYGDPKIVDVEHVHFYHSHNSQGRKQRYTNIVGGHFHEIKTKVDKNGDIVAECGPPLTKKWLRMPNGENRSQVVPVEYWNGYTHKNVVDDHTHDFQYIHSEVLSPNYAPMSEQTKEQMRLDQGAASISR